MMFEEAAVGKALVTAKSIGLAINPVAAGLLFGVTVSVMLIAKGGDFFEQTEDSPSRWWRLLPISADAMPDK